MDYLTRYKSGEYQQVWEELIKLGPEIRQVDLFREAEAVARETMRRVRANLKNLVERLTTLNFNFQYPPLTPLGPAEIQELAGFDREYGPLPLSLKTFFEEVGQVNFMGSHPKLSEYVPSQSFKGLTQNIQSVYRKHFGDVPENNSSPSMDPTISLMYQLLQETARGSVTKDNPERMAKLEAFARDLAGNFSLQIGPNPMANPTPKKPKQPKPDVSSDPLVIDFHLPEIDPNLDEGEEAEFIDLETGLYILELAPDPLHKANYSGSGPSYMLVPNFGFDGEFKGDGYNYGYFVSYLRECLRWGGFPGFKDSKKPPLKEIEFLTRDLLPF